MKKQFIEEQIIAALKDDAVEAKMLTTTNLISFNGQPFAC